MGRPLKIAKATLVTVTATTAATGAVTIAESTTSLSIIRGQRFQVASTVGGLTGGTQYWVFDVIDANNFTVTATQPSNPNAVAATVTDTTSQSVVATIQGVDFGFNNPVGSANTYGVVGGNTGIYGNQVLANIAIGQQGTGTVFASTGSNVVVGLGTDFANVATGSHLYAQWGGDVTVAQLLGTTTSTKGNLAVVVANTTVSGSIIGTSGNAQTLTVNTPVVFDSTFGGLTSGTTYFVKTIANAAAFTVSATPGGAVVTLTANTSVTGNAIQNRVVLSAVSANDASGVNGYGDGFAQALPEAGYILRQKGKTKYLVQGTVTGLVGAVYTANVANTALTPNTMSVIATYDDSSTAYVASVNDYQSEVFPTTVADGSLTPGSVYTIYSSGNTAWTSYGAASNLTGVTFTATSAGGSGTGTAVLNTVNPDVIATFNTAYAANTYGGQPNPIVTINAA
jgi:hypothetical protein